MADTIPVFGIAETDDYVRKILARAGQLPTDSAESLAAALVPHVMHQESRGNPRAVSPKGAVGTMQTMPATLRDPGFGVRPAADDSDEERERVGKDYLLAMVKRYPGRPDLALAAYNAGPGRADRWAKQSGLDPESLHRASAGVEGVTPLAPDWAGLPSADEVPERANFLSNVVGVDSSIGAIARLWEDSGVEFDPNFNLTQLSDEEWKLASEGIPEEWLDGLASAGSRAHLDLLSQRLRARAQAEEELAAYGGWGIAGRFAMGMLDPVAMAVAIGTGGIGATTSGVRLARAAAAARQAGKFDEASTAVKALARLAKGSQWRNSGTVAAVAGAANAGREALLAAGDTTRGGWDVAVAGITGGLLGAGASRVFSGFEMRRLQNAYVRERSALELDELNHKIETRRGELEARLAAEQKGISARVTKADNPEENVDVDILREGNRIGGAGLRVLPNDDGSADIDLGLIAIDPQHRGGVGAASMRAAVASVSEGRQIRNIQSEALSRASLRSMVRAFGKPGYIYSESKGRNVSLEEALDELPPVTPDRADGVLVDGEDAPRIFAEFSPKGGEAAAIRAELDGLDQVRAAGVRASDRAVSAEAEAFGIDTAGAARFTGFDEGVHPHLEGEESGLPTVGKMKLAGAARTGPLATFSGILRGSSNSIVRNSLGRLVGSSTGSKTGINTIGASEHHARIHESMTARFNTAVGPAYKDWAERQGIGLFGRQTRAARERFMSEVGLHIRGQRSADPAVSGAASKVRAVFAEYLTMAKDAGVKGLEEVEFNDRYLPRVFDFKRAYDIEQDIGSDNFRTLVARAIQSENEDVPDALAAKIAKAYVTRMKELRVGSDAHLMNGVRWDDVGFLRRFLNEAGLASDEVEDIVGKFAGINLARQRQTEGSFRNAKKRQQFDENFSMRFRSQKAAAAGRVEDVEVRMSDLFENNIEHLFGRYSRSVSGHIGLAKVGIKSKADFDESIKLVERALADDLDELKRVKDTADLAYKIITGQPVQDATLLTRFGRTMRDYNFSTTMNQVGFAQFPDLAGMISSGYIRYTARHFFDGFRMMRRTDGTLDDEFAAEMESVIGLGSDYHNNAVFSSYDPGEEAGLKGALASTDHTLRVAGRGTQVISGMAGITAFSQRLAGRVIVQRLVKDVLEGGQINARRSAQLGLNDAMKKRIAEQLKKHTQFVDGDFGGKVRIVNYTAWDDLEARDSMMYAVFREARRIVQEEDLGDTAGWMHMNWGKILAQFRRFALVSYSKQLLYGIAHADAEEATRLALSMTMAAMAYKARHELRLAALEVGGTSQEDLDEYRERYLSDDRLAAAAFANSTYSSVLPALADSTTSLLFDERFFDVRTSGLGSDVLTGNPTVSAVNNMGNAVNAVMTSVIRGDRQFDQGDARAVRRLIPFQNVYGLDALYASLTADLPESDEDADPEEFDWFLEN